MSIGVGSMGPTLNLSTNRPGGFRSSIKASVRRVTSSISPVKQDDLFNLADKALPSFSPNRSSTSSRSSRRTLYSSRRAASSSASLSHGLDINGYSPLKARYPTTSSTASPIQKSHTFDTLPSHRSRPVTASASFPYADFNHSSGSVTMATTSFPSESRPSTGKPNTSQSNSVSFGQGGNSVPLPPPLSVPQSLASGSAHNPHTVFQHIQDMSSKRISTLDYLRKA